MSLPQVTMDQTMDTTRPETLDFFQLAAKVIERCLIRDNTAPTLLEKLGITPTCSISTSGLSDHDYPQLHNVPNGLATRTQMRTLMKVPLPAEILKHFNHMQCHCMMGLFTEIKRAWLTIDSDIYVWTYEEGGDVAYYDGLNQTILNVGLVKPKAGVFQGFIKYLLVLTTAVDIVVLGVTFCGTEDEPMQEIQLVAEPVFTIPTDSTVMTTIVGTAYGRMFLGSKDGCLYEITYQAESSWFGKRCKKINHSTNKLSFLVPSFAYTAFSDEDAIAQIIVDDSRNILYTLTERGTIEVYDLGEKGDGLSKVAKVSQYSLVQQATNIVRTLDSQNFYPITSISAIELSESYRVNLVATTQSGARLYLTVTNPQQSNTNIVPRPSRLALLHVRLPPGYSATTHFRPKNVHLSYYRDRNALMVSSTNEKEMLWCIGSDLFPFTSNLMETYTILELDGPVLAMAEIKYDTNMLLQPTQQLPPLVVREHSEPPRKFVVLTAQGAHILIKLRPVDFLRQIIMETRGQDDEAIKTFFTIQQEDQACATTLILATLDAQENEELATLATASFFTYGGEPKLMPQMSLNQTTPYSSPGIFMPNMMSTPMAQYNQNMQNVSMNPNMTFSPGQMSQYYPSNATLMPHQMGQLSDVNSPFQYSSKHNGLYLYVGRILRPLWNLRCVEKVTIDGKKFYYTSTLSSEECSWILNHLNALKRFLLLNTQFKTACVQQVAQPKNPATRGTFTVQDAQMEERQSLNALKAFVLHVTQIIGLWKILSEHQFHVLMDKLQPNDQQILQNTAFKDIFLYGFDICTAVINTLINSYLGDNASVDSISSKLREVCPDLYRAEDAACSKANEILKSAKAIHNLDDKEELILNALNLCKSVSPHINLKEICDQLTALKSYNAVIDLVQTCAKKLDKDDVALHFYKSKDQMDQEAYIQYSRRMEVYKEVTSMLETVYNQNLVQPNVSQLAPQPNIVLMRELIAATLKSPDELLHIAVYEWMLARKLNSELIMLTQPTLETYLIKASQHNPNNLEILDILWKYYESNNNHAAAARILNDMATTSNPAVKLKDRLNYLTRALMCMRSDKAGYAPYLGVFLRELEDKLDIAKVQEKVLNAVTLLRDKRTDAEIAEQHLNLNLYDITQLYEDFAEKFELWECKLAIIYCAGYSDQQLVESIWRNILQNEVNRMGAAGNDKMIAILSKVKTLVKSYRTSSSMVPIEYLIKELELISAKLRADVSLVPQFFVSLEYNYDHLIREYNEAMTSTSRDNFWLAEENENHWYEAIAALITCFVRDHERFHHGEKRRIISIAQDTVASILSILYSKTNAENLILTLRSIQSSLQRM